MKKIFKYLLFSNILVMSCSDFLVVEPDQQISINEQMSSKEGVLEALNGIYRDVEALLSARESIYSDLQGGNLTITPGTNDKIIETPEVVENSYNFSDTPQESDYSNYYQTFYEIINQANVILSFKDNFTFLTTEESNRLQAELLTIRAFSHYHISLYYAQQYGFTDDASHVGVVYVTKPLIAGIDFPARESMLNTYNSIKTDLDLALSLFSSVELLTGPSYSLFNSINTKALYARIALQMNDWELAFQYSDEVLKTSGISLTPKDNYISEWEKNVEPISEIILEFTAPRNSDGNVSSSISSHFIYNSNLNYADYVASGDLLNLYETNDIRTNMFLEISLPTIENNLEIEQTYYFTKKFQGDAGTTYMRLSELYLIRAEANARQNRTNDALIDLNIIRARANLDLLNSSSSILEEIFIERRRELAFEGHLLFDLARFKKDINRTLGCIANTCNLNYPSNFFILPIPEVTINLNENLQQNEGY